MRRCVALLLALGLLSSCGYHLVGTTSFLPEEIETLRVEKFRNQTRWVDMDQRLMEALTLEWVRRRRLQLVETAGQADVVLSGVIQNLAVIPVSYDASGRAAEYQMSLQALIQQLGSIATQEQDVGAEQINKSWIQYEGKKYNGRKALSKYLADPKAFKKAQEQAKELASTLKVFGLQPEETTSDAFDGDSLNIE